MIVGEEHYGKNCSSAKEIASVMTSILALDGEFDRDKEHFWTIGLDVRNCVKYIELCSLGILNAALIHPREVFRPAIAHGVAKLIVCHNHPSRETRPSALDEKITTRLKEAGEIIDILLLDHIIISASGDFTSLSMEGLL